MKLTGMLERKDGAGEKEGLIGSERKGEGERIERGKSLKYLKSSFSTMDSIKHKFFINNKHKNKKHNFNEDNYEEENVCKRETGIKVDDGCDENGLFVGEDGTKSKKKVMSKKKGKKVLGSRGMKKNVFGFKKNKVNVNTNNDLESQFCCTDDEDYNDDTNGDTDDDYCKGNKNKVSFSYEDVVIKDKKSARTRKRVKKFAKKTGSKTWKGVKVGWKFFWTGLRSLSGPFAMWDLTGGVVDVFRDWKVETEKREQLLKRNGGGAGGGVGGDVGWGEGDFGYGSGVRYEKNQEKCSEERGFNCGCGGYGGCTSGDVEDEGGDVKDEGDDVKDEGGNVKNGYGDFGEGGGVKDGYGALGEGDGVKDGYGDEVSYEDYDTSSCIKDENNNNNKDKNPKKKNKKKNKISVK